MDKQVIAAMLCSASAAMAFAQTPTGPGVELYGVVDTGVEYINNVGASAGSVMRMPSLSGGQLPSRWGVRGTEDLGGNLKAVFTLENGFGVDSGQALQGGRAFGRQAFVGLSGGWGALTLGRHWTMSFYSMLDADVIGPSVFGMAALDPYLPNARTDNSLSYRATFGGFTMGATYSLGRDATPPNNCAGEVTGSACRAWSLMGKYDAPTWGVALAQDQLNGGPSGGFFGQPAETVPSADARDKRTILNGYVRIAGGKIGGGWIKRELKAAPLGLSTDLRFLGVSYPLTAAFSIDAQLLAMRDDRPNADARMVVVRGNYALSRRSSVYAMAGHVSNQSNAAYSISAGEAVSAAPAAGRGQTGVMVGMRHSF